MTKDKASSTASSTNYQGSGNVTLKPQGESQNVTPTLHILKGEAKQSALQLVEKDLSYVSNGHQKKLFATTALTARPQTRKNLE